MDDLTNALATETGVSSEQARNGFGALLNFLKERLGDENFQKLEAAIPGAASMIANSEAAQGTTQGGLFDAISALAGRLFGGKAEGIAELLTSLGKLGFQPAQIETFLAKAPALLKQHLPPELVERIMTALPGAATMASSEAN